MADKYQFEVEDGKIDISASSYNFELEKGWATSCTYYITRLSDFEVILSKDRLNIGEDFKIISKNTKVYLERREKRKILQYSKVTYPSVTISRNYFMIFNAATKLKIDLTKYKYFVFDVDTKTKTVYLKFELEPSINSRKIFNARTGQPGFQPFVNVYKLCRLYRVKCIRYTLDINNNVVSFKYKTK